MCLSVSERVSELVCHTKRVERSTDRNLPPIFTKLATKVESQEISAKAEVELILTIAPMELQW